MSSKVVITGLDATVRDLRKLGVKSQDLRGAFNAVGSRVKERVKARTPKNTGRLQAGITNRVSRNKVVLQSNTRGKRPYHRYVFFGTKRMPARPYLWQGVDAYGGARVRQDIEAELNRVIRQSGLG